MRALEVGDFEQERMGVEDGGMRHSPRHFMDKEG